MLYACTLPVNKKPLKSTVPANKKHLTCTVSMGQLTQCNSTDFVGSTGKAEIVCVLKIQKNNIFVSSGIFFTSITSQAAITQWLKWRYYKQLVSLNLWTNFVVVENPIF